MSARPHAKTPRSFRGGARHASVVALLAALSGCAGFSADGGFSTVDSLTRERVGQSPRFARTPEARDDIRKRVEALLARPLDAEAAVEIALINNPALQASYHDLGIAEADLVQAGRLRNPTFGFLNVHNAESYKIERSVVFDLIGLLTMPLAREVESRRFEQTQLDVAGRAAAAANEARRAWHLAVASAQLVQYFEQVRETAAVSAELARRMGRAGNATALAVMREQAFLSESVAQLARAKHQAVADRERLARALGLWGDDLAFRLPERLPDPPASPETPESAEQTAIDKRLDVLAAKRSAEGLAKSLGLTKATRFVNVLEGGYANMNEGGEPRKSGYEIRLTLPVFDFGGTQVARAESVYMQAVSRTADVAVRARSQVREAYSAYRTAFDLAKHYREEVVPLRKRISDETLLRYNGMLVGPFEVLADAREQVAAVTAAIEAQRDFWLADTELRAALTAGTPDFTAAAPRARTAASSGAAGH